MYNRILHADEHPDMSGLSEKACRPLIREKDEEVQGIAIEAVGKAIEQTKISEC